MRSKEEANDYRYFPDPDLLPVELDEAFLEAVRKNLPELPDARKARFAREHGLSDYDAAVLTASRELADYFGMRDNTDNFMDIDAILAYISSL